MKFKKLYSVLFLGLISLGMNQLVYANDNQPSLLKEVKYTDIKAVDGSDSTLCTKKLGTGGLLKLYEDEANGDIHHEFISTTGKIYKGDIRWTPSSIPKTCFIKKVFSSGF